MAGAIKRITDRDQAVFEVLAQNRFADTEHLHWLVQGDKPLKGTNGLPSSPYKKLRERLRKLYDHHYIDKVTVPGRWYSRGGRGADVYALDDRGAELLIERGYELVVPKNRRGYWRKKNRSMERTEENLPTGMAGGIRHRLVATHFLTSLRRARTSSAEINWLSEADWLAHAGSISVPIRAPSGGPLVRQPLRPDAYFTLTYPEQGKRATRHFFLEADRGTEPGRRADIRFGTSLFKKFLAYETWMRSRGHEKLGMPGFTVLTITTSFDRAWNLRDVAREVGGRGGSHAYWFAAEEQYRTSPRDLVGEAFISAGDCDHQQTRLHHLLESPARTHQHCIQCAAA